MRKTLLLFTGSYPYAVAAENTFLPQELEILRRHFESVIVIPTAIGGARVAIEPSNVVVETSFARFISSPTRRAIAAFAGIADLRLSRELAPRLLGFLLKPRGFVRAVRAHVTARLTERWIAGLGGRFRWADCLFYTWWFEGTTLGLATFGNRAGVPTITRAHGRDVYEYRHDPPHIPFRKPSLDLITAVFSASESGARYMADRYPDARGKIHVALLGVDDPGFASPPSADGVFRIVSCSALVGVKRVDLMIRGIAEAGRTLADRRLEWTHIGVGPEKAALVSLAAVSMPRNVSHRFVDYTGKEALYAHYRTQPADVFMNLSASEGTPVAIMEAISVGIPVIATAVGGNPEIVGPDNGIVVPADPQPRDIAQAIGSLIEDPSRRAAMRRASRARWSERYSAERNYSAFAETIRAL